MHPQKFGTILYRKGGTFWVVSPGHLEDNNVSLIHNHRGDTYLASI